MLISLSTVLLRFTNVRASVFCSSLWLGSSSQYGYTMLMEMWVLASVCGHALLFLSGTSSGIDHWA